MAHQQQRKPIAAVILALACLVTTAASAQWQLLDAHTTANLRGIDNVGGGVAWASGSNGTILRTEDAGFVWQLCTIPPGAAKLDFRGIQAFDANTAIAMSSGPGDQSRLYKTTDGCQTWKLVFTNPDKDGFWDALVARPDGGFLMGDPVKGRFVVYVSQDPGLEKWERFGEKADYLHFPYDASKNEALFAASNSTIEGDPNSNLAFVTGGESGSRFYLGLWNSQAKIGHIGAGYFEANLPLARGATAGAFSLGGSGEIRHGRHYVAVGGDYSKSDLSAGTAAYSNDGGERWRPAKSLPHGYRSAVAYDAPAKTWITVGPNGTDISSDDGRNWRALRPSKADAPDADKDWNALSLPYVVGQHGRIGVLRKDALAAK